MISFHTLENVPLKQIATAFNEAFSDYFIPLQLSEGDLENKIRSEGIQLPLSVGAFAEGELVGFIVHGYDELNGVKTIYNGGTGVIPAYRGKGITASLYQYAIPLLKQQNIHDHLLEVIEGNLPAIKVYEKTGFVIRRELSAFKCSDLRAATANPAISVRMIQNIPDDPAYGDAQPTWQNATPSIMRDPDNHAIIGAFAEGELMGYAVYAPAAGRVKQFGVHEKFRRRKAGTALFQYVMQNSSAEKILATNIDNNCTSATAFLQAIGFEKVLGCYEMEMHTDR